MICSRKSLPLRIFCNRERSLRLGPVQTSRNLIVTRFFATNKSSNQCHLTEAILELFLAGEERNKSVAVGWTPGVEQPVKLQIAVR